MKQVKYAVFALLATMSSYYLLTEDKEGAMLFSESLVLLLLLLCGYILNTLTKKCWLNFLSIFDLSVSDLLTQPASEFLDQVRDFSYVLFLLFTGISVSGAFVNVSWINQFSITNVLPYLSVMTLFIGSFAALTMILRIELVITYTIRYLRMWYLPSNVERKSEFKIIEERWKRVIRLHR